MTHEEKIAELAKAVHSEIQAGRKVKIAKASVSHFVPNPYDKSGRLPKLDLSMFTDILDVNVHDKTCVAESGVTFSELAKETLKHGLVPHVVPELKGITVGGAISGCALESMSYRYGGFHDSCLEYEVVTGAAEVISCSRDANPDLFEMMHGSYGTLGLLTKAKFRLLPAKKFVKMIYRTFPTFNLFWAFLKERCALGDYDFIDAIIHGKNAFVVCLGQMTDSAPYLSSYNWLNIFYKSTLRRHEDYLTAYDYFFRFDAECHWLTRTVPLAETKPVRLVAGKFFLGSTNLIKWSNRLKGVMRLKKRPDVVVDVFIPSVRFEEFYRWYEAEFDFYPLWIVPYRIERPYPWINDAYAAGLGTNLFIDCAVYGKRNNRPKLDYSVLLEKKTLELNGIKTLISRNHFSRDEFWRVYNKTNYDRVKQETDPHGIFMDIYDKFA